MVAKYESLKIPGKGVCGQGGNLGTPSPRILSTLASNSNFAPFLMSVQIEIYIQEANLES